MNNIIVNADDLGMTPGTNKAIFEGFDHGIVTHSSIMSNCDYFTEAVDGLEALNILKSGAIKALDGDTLLLIATEALDIENIDEVNNCIDFLESGVALKVKL